MVNHNIPNTAIQNLKEDFTLLKNKGKRRADLIAKD